MSIGNFKQIIDKLKDNNCPKRVAVVAAQDKHTLEAVLMAYKDGIAMPVLIGDAKIVSSYLEDLGCQDKMCIVHATSHEDAARHAVEMINAGEADFIMKGLIETAVLMKIVVSRENNLRTDKVMSHVAFLDIPTYHKLLAVTDAALNTYPNLEQKKQIVENAVDALVKMGVKKPKVAIMAAAEEINPKLVESVEANELKKMNLSGELKDCIIEGPISYDLAINREAADIKGYSSVVAGDADLMVVPNLTAGNLMVKALLFSAGAKVAGFIVGAKVPVVLTSRASTTEDKYLSIILAASAC